MGYVSRLTVQHYAFTVAGSYCSEIAVIGYYKNKAYFGRLMLLVTSRSSHKMTRLIILNMAFDHSRNTKH